MAISPQQLTIYSYSAHRAVIFAIAQLSCFDMTLQKRKLFQVLAAATANARLPIVESRISGTASAEVDDELRVSFDTLLNIEKLSVLYDLKSRRICNSLIFIL